MKSPSRKVQSMFSPFQDPQNMSETVIVIRSLIPGGVAYHSKRIVPGDRLVYVNEIRLDNASLDMAVQALKGASFGPVKLGIGRPLNDNPGDVGGGTTSRQQPPAAAPPTSSSSVKGEDVRTSKNSMKEIEITNFPTIKIRTKPRLRKI